ncbi:MAG: M50 family metallopeptidase [Fuerstiella sp.]
MSIHDGHHEHATREAIRRVLGGVSVLAYSWFLMMVIHEAGHISGAIATGGTVQKIQLQPLAISKTDVAPNPNALFVVWAGPLVGALFPLTALAVIRPQNAAIWQLALFFTGFCLIANGAYIAAGSFDQVGDCKVMLKEGSPMWMLWLFGGISIPAGFFLWHRMGSFRRFLSFQNFASVHAAKPCIALLILAAIQLITSFV